MTFLLALFFLEFSMVFAGGRGGAECVFWAKW